MLKPITLFLLVTIFVTGTMYGQTLSNLPKGSQISLQESISLETEKHNNEFAAIDVKKMEQAQQRIPQRNWNTKKVILVTVLVVVLVGVVAVVAYNSKRCIKRDPSGCDFANDINCKCVQYSE